MSRVWCTVGDGNSLHSTCPLHGGNEIWNAVSGARGSGGLQHEAGRCVIDDLEDVEYPERNACRGIVAERVLDLASRLFGKDRLSPVGNFRNWDDGFHAAVLDAVFCGSSARPYDVEALWSVLIAEERLRMRAKAEETEDMSRLELVGSGPDGRMLPEDALETIRRIGHDAGAAAMLGAVGAGVDVDDIVDGTRSLSALVLLDLTRAVNGLGKSPVLDRAWQLHVATTRGGNHVGSCC